MTDLRIRITESDGIAFAGLSDNRYPQAIYRGAKARNALDRIIDGLQDYARAEPAEMVDALHFCPEFCQLAAAVHGLHLAESDETPTTEAIAILTKLRDSRQPEAIRTRAGNLLIDIAEDDRAVCDASSVDERPGQDAGAELVGVECYFSNNGRDWTPFSTECTGVSPQGQYSSITTEVKSVERHFAGALWKHAKPAEVTP